MFLSPSITPIGGMEVMLRPGQDQACRCAITPVGVVMQRQQQYNNLTPTCLVEVKLLLSS